MNVQEVGFMELFSKLRLKNGYLTDFFCGNPLFSGLSIFLYQVARDNRIAFVGFGTDFALQLPLGDFSADCRANGALRCRAAERLR